MMKRHARQALALILLGLIALTAVRAGNRNTYPMPDDRGTAGTLAALEKLPVRVRVLQVTAHPDDESAGTLVWLSRKVHARTAIFCLTRGEGGQNILGDEKYEAMGLLRTGEFLEACKFYGVGLHFSTAFDFGFSKNADETLAKWGHEAILQELVRFIRTWQPTILISKFEGTPRDGHGHHQAAGILSREAFEAAGDPSRFSEQLKAGLVPWKSRKFYVGSIRTEAEPPPSGGPIGSAAPSEGAIRIPIGDYDPVLGRSYREIGAEGYIQHRSQGNGALFSLPGAAYDYYRLLKPERGPGPKEAFFDAIDTSVENIAELSGAGPPLPFLRDSLSGLVRLANEALQSFRVRDPAPSAAKIAEGIALLQDTMARVRRAELPQGPNDSILKALQEKLEDFHDAANATLGVYLVARPEEGTAIPGQRVPITAYLFNRGSAEIELKNIGLRLPEGWTSGDQSGPGIGKLAPGSSSVFRFPVKLSPGAQVTEPFWYRESPRDDRYGTRPTPDPFAPFGPPEAMVAAEYTFQNASVSITAPARAQFGNPIRGADFNDFLVVPALSVTVKPQTVIAPLSRLLEDRDLQVIIANNDRAGSQGVVKVNVPAGWRVAPPQLDFSLQDKGATFTGRFTVRIPPGVQPGSYPLDAVASSQGREFRRGYRVVSYPGIWTRNLYESARAVCEVFDLKVAPRLNVGYVTGAGDEVPAALQQLGIPVHMLGAQELAFGDLNRFSAIVTGVRAYNVNEDLRTHNQRLLKYVESGGRLIVQYNTPLRAAPGRNDSPFPYGPYTMANSTADRITVEESPVTILEPQSPLFNVPNKISAADFQGWVQERGLYFMEHWDPRYTAVLAGNDPGEDPKKGGMLLTRYGKGWYIYSAYSWFRQLPAGVPGAYRIFANMLGLGAAK
jgi:LmbE family N-acetylglucosaminyl deacetylase